MLAEFKRDSARKELETVLQQIHQKRMELQRIEEELEAEEEEEDSSEEDKVKVNQEQVSWFVSWVTQTARNGVMAMLYVNVTCSFHYRLLNFNNTQNCDCNISLHSAISHTAVAAAVGARAAVAAGDQPGETAAWLRQQAASVRGAGATAGSCAGAAAERAEDSPAAAGDSERGEHFPHRYAQRQPLAGCQGPDCRPYMYVHYESSQRVSSRNLRVVAWVNRLQRNLALLNWSTFTISYLFTKIMHATHRHPMRKKSVSKTFKTNALPSTG